MKSLALVLCLLTVACGAPEYEMPGASLPRIQLGRVTDESIARVLAWMDAQEAAGAGELVIDIDSSGGDVDAGFALIRRLDARRIIVYCVVDGWAASMGFAILQSCDSRLMTNRSLVMTHEAYITNASGGDDAEYLAAVNETLAAQCARRLNLTIERYKAKVAAGVRWWMRPAEALSVGAVDRVVYPGEAS